METAKLENELFGPEETDVPFAVQNYRDAEGWKQAEITAGENERIQEEVRARNVVVMDACISDARLLLAERKHQLKATPGQTLELAMFLAERRMVHVSRVYDEFLTKKIAESRKALGCLAVD